MKDSNGKWVDVGRVTGCKKWEDDFCWLIQIHVDSKSGYELSYF